MYESFFGFKERPFSLLPDPSFLFPSRRHAMAATMLEYAIESQAGITLVTGDIGMGKTTLVRHLLNRLGDSVAVGLINNTHRSFGELLQWVNLAFDLPYEGKDKVALFQAFQNHLIQEYAKGRRTILIVDEAQNMDSATLEELRVLSNINADKFQVLQLILVGQPELRSTLRRAELEQFVQRIGVDYHIAPFDENESSAYIQHRLRCVGGNPNLFSAEAERFIHNQAGGVPRVINSLCDMALVYAYADQLPSVSLDLVTSVIKDKIDNGLFGTARIATEAAPEQLEFTARQRAAFEASLNAALQVEPTNHPAVAVWPDTKSR